MVEVKQYRLPPTALIPNSPYPLLHYPGLLKSQLKTPSDNIAPQVYELFLQNGWKTHWIFRYGHTQESHYHRQSHETMAVLSGSATIRFGVADTDPDLEASTHGGAKEDGGVEIHAEAGDVFILPAGTAHKTHDTSPAAEFALLTPGNSNGVEAEDPVAALREIKLSGFTMLGAYPDGRRWDYATGGEDAGHYESVWGVPRPELDPVLGRDQEGLCGLWREVDMSGCETGKSRGEDFYKGGMTVDVDFLK